MKKTGNPNINFKSYWDDIYETPKKRELYSCTGTSVEGSTPINQRFEKALGFIKDGDKVVDMGCGVGVFTTLVKKAKPLCEVWGTDISQKVIDANRGVSDIVYRQQYIGAQSALSPDYFDVVFSGEVLEHLDDPNDLFRDAKRVLKQGGKFILTTPVGEMISSPEHVWAFEHEDIEKLYLSNGFKKPEFVYLPKLEHLLIIFAVGEKL